ncbi:c-type cytochrome [Sphingomonas sp.]|uniref:c-type cytochrome n=1 Tax=Sphingomonas sp. TaxID=28214 RepID=UPI003B3AA353
MRTTLSIVGAGLLIMGGSGAAGAAPKGNPAQGEKLFARCAACHKVGPNAAKSIGPALNGVIGRKAATQAGFNYSPALTKSGLTWDPATLARFLQAPMKTVPGTRMFFPGLANPKDQADVVAYLQQFGPDGKKK